jgi:hypothetical protein
VDAILVLFAIVDVLILLDLLALLLGPDPRRSVGDDYQRRNRGEGLIWLGRRYASLRSALLRSAKGLPDPRQRPTRREAGVALLISASGPTPLPAFRGTAQPLANCGERTSCSSAINGAHSRAN